MDRLGSRLLSPGKTFIRKKGEARKKFDEMSNLSFPSMSYLSLSIDNFNPKLFSKITNLKLAISKQLSEEPAREPIPHISDMVSNQRIPIG